MFVLLCVLCLPFCAACRAATPSFKDFDQRAKAGERLSVVFFGASLTWGANASDPQLTSYRGLLASKLEEAYPQAHFKFWDAAIGGTGSRLGVFRFERDVLRRKPDLVFLDFSANDDIYAQDEESLAAYESLVRRAILDARAAIVQVILPFKWNVTGANLDGMKRREDHLAIAKAYNVPTADVIELCFRRIQAKEVTADQLWPFDGVHPGDAGYVLFTEAVWQAFQSGVQTGMVCAAPPAASKVEPPRMLHADTCMKNIRARISTLGEPPQGWRVTVPNPVSAYFDMLMSRWLDDETIASNRKELTVNGKKQSVPQEPARLKAKFKGRMVLLFGESTPKSGKFRAYIDGKVVEQKGAPREFDAGDLGRRMNGNAHLEYLVATGLDPNLEHTLEIEPLFAADSEQELRLESICVAGGVEVGPYTAR